MKKKIEISDFENILIDYKAMQYEIELDGLTNEEQTLFIFRKIMDLYKKISNPDDLANELMAIKKASKCSIKDLLIIFSKEGTTKDIQKVKEVYQETWDSYTKILENYKLLAEELDIDNSLDLSHLFSYMLWNGYYSVSKKHVYQAKKKIKYTRYVFF